MKEFDLSERLKRLPTYLFVEIDRAKEKAIRGGRNIIDFGVGDPDLSTPSHIIESLYRAAKNPETHRYSLDKGLLEFRQAISRWYKKRFNVELDPEKEVHPLIGSKEGIAHLPLTVINRGDYALVPDPGYPPYRSGVILAEGVPYSMPLLKENSFLPDLRKIPSRIRKRAKIMFLNYPNNPTAAVATKEFFKEIINFASKYNIIIAHDAAYSEITFDGYRSPSFLETEGAKNVGIEFHSLSKTYNMTGWRIGWVCGNREIVSFLAKLKSNIDSGIFMAIQIAGISALEEPQNHIEEICQVYRERRDILVDGLNSLGWDISKPKATFYLWTEIPKGHNSLRFCSFLLKKSGILVTPGIGFGKFGEGYIRFSLTIDKERIKEAVERLKRLKW